MGTQDQAFVSDVIFADGEFQPGGVVVDDRGKIVATGKSESAVKNLTRLKDRAVLPGLVNAHSHAFQRVIRGQTEYRSGRTTDSFWTWRERMYSAAARLGPDDIYDASRMAFLEMALSGITSVGEFHYLHHAPDGTPYDDPNLLAKEVVRAARDVGLRICLLRVAYERSGFELDQNPQQLRFIERDPETYLRNLEELSSEQSETVTIGIAPHSVRAVSLPYLKRIIQFGDTHSMVVHMHVAEQPAEVAACVREHGRSPVAVLGNEGLLSERFTAVHAIHVTEADVSQLGKAGAIVCACPSTERNLGDGVVPANLYFNEGVRVSLGSDSHVQIDLLEDARELEYHLRLQRLERVVLAPGNNESRSALAKHLYRCATEMGGASIGFETGTISPGKPADFFSIDLNDTSIAGAPNEDLISSVVFSLARTAVKDVVVGGKMIVKDGRHQDQEEIVQKFQELQKRLWS